MQEVLFVIIGLVVGVVVAYLYLRLRSERERGEQLRASERATAELQQAIQELERVNGELVQSRQAVERLEGELAAERGMNVKLATEKENLTERVGEASQQLTDLAARSKELSEELTRTTMQFTRLQAEYKALQGQLDNYEQEQGKRDEMMLSQFKNLASEIMDEKSKTFKEMSGESLKSILDPLNRDIDGFRKQVAQCYDEDNKGRAALQSMLTALKEQNEKVQREADKLSSALRGGTKVQGDWGEMILLNILQQSGLQQGRDFEIQKAVDDPNENKRPDAVLHFPNHNDLIIDSKVSFTAYDAYMNATDENDRATYARQHLRSVTTHIEQLAARDYASFNKKSHNFVIMFIPIESMFMLALDEARVQGRNLWNEAYDKRIIIMTPTNLVLAVRMLQDMWRQESLRNNIEKIKERAEKMYAQFASLASDMESVRLHIKNALSSCDSAVGRLTTGNDNLMSQFEKMQKLGLQPKVAKGAQKNFKALRARAGVEDDATVVEDDAPEAIEEPAEE